MDLFSTLGIDVSIEDGEWAKYMPAATKHGTVARVGNLPHGTADGKPAFQILAKLDDGSMVVVETTWELMATACDALKAAWPRTLS